MCSFDRKSYAVFDAAGYRGRPMTQTPYSLNIFNAQRGGEFSLVVERGQVLEPTSEQVGDDDADDHMDDDASVEFDFGPRVSPPSAGNEDSGASVSGHSAQKRRRGARTVVEDAASSESAAQLRSVTASVAQMASVMAGQQDLNREQLQMTREYMQSQTQMMQQMMQYFRERDMHERERESSK